MSTWTLTYLRIQSKEVQNMSKELFVKAEEGVQRVGYLQALRLQAGTGNERGTETERFHHYPRTSKQTLF